MKRKSVAVESPDGQVPESTWLFRQVVRLLTPVFGRLRAWDNRATIRQKKIALLVFCAGVAMLLTLSVYVGTRTPRVAKPMHLPALLPPPGDGIPQLQMTPGRLRRLLDSIRAQPGGDQILDSLQKNRPGLLDTLEQIDVYK